MKSQVAQLTKAAGGTETGSSESNAGEKDPSGTASSKPEKDPNKIVVDAIMGYREKMDEIYKSDRTAIQEKTAWFAATKELDALLKRNRVIVTGEIVDVGFDEKYKTAYLRIGSMAIKTSDTKGGKIALYGEIHDGTTNMTIVATPTTAAKIKKGSRLTIEGMTALGVNFSTPISRQPDRYKRQNRRDNPIPKGYRLLGAFQTDSTGKREGLELLWQDKSVVKVDGSVVKVKQE